MTAGNVFPFGPRIYTMASHGGYLYLGGDFAGAGYKPASYLTRWELPGPSGVAETPPPVPEGAQLLAWDGRDDAGREVVPGVYLARLVTRTGTAATRVVRVR